LSSKHLAHFGGSEAVVLNAGTTHELDSENRWSYVVINTTGTLTVRMPCAKGLHLGRVWFLNFSGGASKIVEFDDYGGTAISPYDIGGVSRSNMDTNDSAKWDVHPCVRCTLIGNADADGTWVIHAVGDGGT
jgi:hypothetical protein